MKHEEFRIGLVFKGLGGFPYRCTDVGTRTITAIALPLPEYFAAWDNPLWLQGPPYILDEEVFDEKAMGDCYLSFDESLRASVEALDTSAHPGFDGDDMWHMMDVEHELDKLDPHYSRKGVLRFDRVRADGEILHAYAGKKGEGDAWTILALELFTRKYVELDELAFIALPRADESHLRARAERVGHKPRAKRVQAAEGTSEPSTASTEPNTTDGAGSGQ